MKPGVSVVIPSIGKPRKGDLGRALMSCLNQTLFPNAVHVSVDKERKGAWWARQLGLDAVDTEWVAFLDDDDALYPNHLERLLEFQAETGADLVYPWFELDRPDNDFDADSILKVMHGGELVNPMGVPFDDEAAAYLRVNNFIPVTVLVRTELAKDVGFPTPQPDDVRNDWHHPDEQEEWGFQLRLLDAGAKFAHLPERTWIWRHHYRNTSGKPHHADEMYFFDDDPHMSAPIV